MTNEEFLAGLSEGEWGEAVAIETELGKILEQGLTKEVSIKFIRTVMAVRKAMPSAQIGGIFDQALDAGLGYFLDARTLAGLRSGQIKGPGTGKRRSTLK